jgi:signal transduction histidine kinase
MLSKIYLKLYFWFLLVFILTIAVVSMMIHGFYVERVRDELEGQLQSHARFLLEGYQDVCGSPEKRMSPECSRFLTRLSRIQPLHFWIVDRSGKVVMSNDRFNAPQVNLEDLARAANGEHVTMRRRAPHAIIPIRNDRGVIEEYAVVQRAFMPPERFPRFPFFASLIVVLITIAILILPLSKRLTKPVSQLHQLGQDWAEGHLEKRALVSSKDEISDLAQTFNTMAEKLQNMLQQRKEFLASISHELKSPLARMRIALELLSEKTTEADAEKFIQSIQNEIQESEKLIEELLVLSRIEMSVPVPHETLQIEKVVERAITQTKPVADYEGISLKTSGEGRVKGDPYQLEKAMVNILENAIKFSQRGQTVEFNVIQRDRNVILQCKDEGPGIEQAEVTKLFDPFFRGAASSGKSGFGLGLFIARRIVEMHSGTIRAKANQPRGMVIEITFPGI